MQVGGAVSSAGGQRVLVLIGLGCSVMLVGVGWGGWWEQPRRPGSVTAPSSSTASIHPGVDYEAILRQAEKEGDVVIWDGGNNDSPFFK